MWVALLVGLAVAAGVAAIYFAQHGWTHGVARFHLRLSIWRLRRRLATRRDEHRSPERPRS